jgi:hypothetical protein
MPNLLQLPRIKYRNQGLNTVGIPTVKAPGVMYSDPNLGIGVFSGDGDGARMFDNGITQPIAGLPSGVTDPNQGSIADQMAALGALPKQNLSLAQISKMTAGQPNTSGIESRIAQARSNLGYGTLLGMLGTTLQNANRQVAPVNDRYLDQTADSIPQYVKDQANNNIDRTASASINNVMASGAPLNKAANTYAVINAQATNAKSNLAAQQATTDVSLRNQKLLRKQQRLDRFGNDTANAANMVTDNNNTKIGNVAALGTNYFNQIQKSISNEYALQDQAEERKVYLEQLRQLRRSA